MTNDCKRQVLPSSWFALVASCLAAVGGCNPSPPAWAGPTPDAANAGHHVSVADAGAPASSSPPQIMKASRRPPKLPYNSRRVCSQDSDCAIVPPRPCMCDDCGTSWHEVMNKRELRKLQSVWARRQCVATICPKCESHLLGTKAICRAGQCTIE